MAISPRIVTLERAEHARAGLAEQAFRHPNVTAVGLSTRDDGYVVRVRVTGADDPRLPDSFEGVPIEIVSEGGRVTAQTTGRVSALRRLAQRSRRLLRTTNHRQPAHVVIADEPTRGRNPG